MLQQALQLTQNMLNLAKQKNWEALDPIEKKRQLLLDALFPLADSSVEIKKVATDLQKLIDTNNELIAHCQKGKQSLQLQMRDAKFTQKAVTAYQSN
ncbi:MULTISPECIES: flagellar protein FliT [unclassified Methylophaga]|nr:MULTISPECIES: flagellar protein FliT [unclassified Methylophaga]